MRRVAMAAGGRDDLAGGEHPGPYYDPPADRIPQRDIDSCAPDIPHRSEARHQRRLREYGGLKGDIRRAFCKSFQLRIRTEFTFQVDMRIDQPRHHRPVLQIDGLVSSGRSDITLL